MAFLVSYGGNGGFCGIFLVEMVGDDVSSYFWHVYGSDVALLLADVAGCAGFFFFLAQTPCNRWRKRVEVSDLCFP